MSQDLLQQARESAGAALQKPTEGLSADELYALVQQGIAAERDMRKQAFGGGSTLTLNTLLGVEEVIAKKILSKATVH